jgi:hypothetical protein
LKAAVGGRAPPQAQRATHECPASSAPGFGHRRSRRKCGDSCCWGGLEQQTDGGPRSLVRRTNRGGATHLRNDPHFSVRGPGARERSRGAPRLRRGASKRGDA